MRFLTLALAIMPGLMARLPAQALDFRAYSTLGEAPASAEMIKGQIDVNRPDKPLVLKDIDGTPGHGSLLNTLPSGRKAVEQGRGDDLKLIPTGGATANTLSALLGRTVYVTDFMAIGSTDITAALPAAASRLGVNGGKILFPFNVAGYTIISKFQAPSKIFLESDGRFAATITSNFDGDVISFGDGITTNDSAGLRNITFRSSVKRTQGAAVALRAAYNFKGSDIICDVKPYVCVDIQGVLGPSTGSRRSLCWHPRRL